MEEIRYKVISMRYQRPQENTEAVLILYDDYLEWKADFIAEEPKSAENDLSIGWEKVHAFYHIVISRDKIGSIEMEFQQTPERYADVDKDKWGVYIIKPGESDIKMWFRTQSKAEEVFNKVKQWWLKNKS